MCVPAGYSADRYSNADLVVLPDADRLPDLTDTGRVPALVIAKPHAQLRRQLPRANSFGQLPDDEFPDYRPGIPLYLLLRGLGLHAYPSCLRRRTVEQRNLCTASL